MCFFFLLPFTSLAFSSFPFWRCECVYFDLLYARAYMCFTFVYTRNTRAPRTSTNKTIFVSFEIITIRLFFFCCSTVFFVFNRNTQCREFSRQFKKKMPNTQKTKNFRMYELNASLLNFHVLRRYPSPSWFRCLLFVFN